MPDSRLIRRPFKMTSKSLRRERILHILIVRATSVFYTQVKDSYLFNHVYIQIISCISFEENRG